RARLLGQRAEETIVLAQSGARFIGAAAIGGLVAEDAAHAHLLERAADVIDQGGGARAYRLDRAHQRAHLDRLVVELAIELPPHALQDLQKALWRIVWRRHAARQRRVQVRVRAHEAG